MKNLMNALGYQFRNTALLKQALTHPSMGKDDNQRLEFLGDAVLQYLMSDILYASHPESKEDISAASADIAVTRGPIFLPPR